MGKLDGRVAAITSGSTGIGRGIAEGFLAEGAKVVLNGRNADKGAKALEDMGAGDNGFFVQGDATVREDIDKLIDGAVEHFGRIDILVNNAGGLIKTAPVMDLSDEDWDYADPLEPLLGLLGHAARRSTTWSRRASVASSTSPRSRASTASPASPPTSCPSTR